jgi:hypothetical protein
VTSPCRNAGRERGLEHLPGFAGIPDDQDLRLFGGRDHGGRPPERQSQIGVEELAGDPPDAVGSEQDPHPQLTGLETTGPAAACT